jgi:electron transport complex protein RnfC
MLENPEQLVAGMKIILKLFDNAKGIFGVEDNKPDCIEKLKELTKNEPRMEVLALKTKYPQGGERQLIFATTGRAINSAMLPADAGCVVDNVETIINVYRAVAEGKPSMERVVTVSGDAVNEPGNFKALFGMNQMELIEAAGGFKTEPEKVISGGPMMGFAMFTLDVPVTKTSSAILCFTKDEVAELEPSACINCGRCIDACPSRIIPSRLADFAERHDEESYKKWDGLECVECGSCSYVCPAKRPLKQAIGSMRKIALANLRKK